MSETRSQDPSDIPDEVDDVVEERPHSSHRDFTDQPTMTLWRRVLLRPAVPGIPTPPVELAVPTGTGTRYLTSDLIRRGLLVLALAALLLAGLGYGLGYLTASGTTASTSRHGSAATPAVAARAATATPAVVSAWRTVWQSHGTGDDTVTPPSSAYKAAPRFLLTWYCDNGDRSSTIYLQVTIMQAGKPLPITFRLCPGYGNVVLTKAETDPSATLSNGPFTVHMQAPSGTTWTVSIEVPR